jgi:hypothetical protein
VSPRRRNIAAENAARERRFRARGWNSYGQYRYWNPRLTDPYVKELADQIGGPVEPSRARSLMSDAANAIVNPKDRTRVPPEWKVRLLVAAGKIKEAA